MQLGDERVGLRLKVVEVVERVDGSDIALSEALLGTHKAPAHGELVEVVEVPVELQSGLVALDISASVGVFAVVCDTLVGSHLLHFSKDVVGEVGGHF